MNIGILGTGVVGRAHAAKLAALGHDVVIGTRDTARTLAQDSAGRHGQCTFQRLARRAPRVKLAAFAEAAAHGEIVINAIHGAAAVETLKPLERALDGKVLIDITNPLDFSKGMPPSLFVSNTDSLGEQIQRALPKTKVVKTLNTMNAMLQVDARRLAGGDHHVFLSGNDAPAKARVTALLGEWYGWENVIDLGDITTARGAEMILPLWVRLWGVLQTPFFNFKIVK